LNKTINKPQQIRCTSHNEDTAITGYSNYHPAVCT